MSFHYSLVCTKIDATFENCNQADDVCIFAVKRRATKPRLNLEQYLELLLGPKGAASCFDDDACRRRAWQEHGGELMPLVDPGSRPWGWWQYDAPEPPMPREPESAYLARCGLLTGTELARLEAAGVHIASHATRNP